MRGKVTIIFNQKCWLAKNKLKSSVFILKLVIKSPLRKRGGIKWGFLLFKNVFSKDPYAFKLLLNLVSLVDILE